MDLLDTLVTDEPMMTEILAVLTKFGCNPTKVAIDVVSESSEPLLGFPFTERFTVMWAKPRAHTST